MNRVLLCALVVTGGACVYDWAAYEPQPGAGGTSAASQGGGGATMGPGGAGGAGAGASGGGGQGASGGTGGTPLPSGLVDRELLVRYFVDEAASGTSPSMLIDASTPATNLAINYDADIVGGGGAGGAGTPEPDMTFEEVASGHRALDWPVANQDGRASATTVGTELIALNGFWQATVECVARVVDGHSTGSRLMHIGTDSAHGTLALCSKGSSNLQARMNDTILEEWAVDLSARTVIHYVLDTSHGDVDARARIYIDGADIGNGTTQTRQPTVGETFTMTDQTITLGNRADGNRSIKGSIFYCALYGTALTDNEIAHNASLLAISDDTP